MATHRGSKGQSAPSFKVYAELDSSDLRAGLSELNDAMGMSLTEINQGAELAAKAFGTVKIAGQLALAVFISLTSAAIDYGEAMAEVQTISDRAEFSTDRINTISRDLADTYGSGVTENARALYQTISAGTTEAAAATDLLDASAKLSIGGLTDMTVAVDALTTAVNAYRGTGLTAADASDALFVAIRDGKTTASELADQIGQVAGIARQAGVSFDEMAASVAAITTNGITTETAVIQLRQILASVLKPSSEAAAEAKRLGVEFSVSALKARGLKGVLDEITSAAQFNDTSLTRLFGNVRALAGAMALTANGGEKLSQILDDMEEKTGASDAAFGRMSATLGFQVRRFEALQDSMGVTLGGMVEQSDEARAGLTAINDAQADLIKIFSSPEGAEAVNLFFGLIRHGFADAIDAYLGFSKMMESDFVTRFAAAGDIVNQFNVQLMLIRGIDFDELEDAGDRLINGVTNATESDPVLDALEQLANRLRAGISEGVQDGLTEGFVKAAGAFGPGTEAAKGLGGLGTRFGLPGLGAGTEFQALMKLLKERSKGPPPPKTKGPTQLSFEAEVMLAEAEHKEEIIRDQQERLFDLNQEMAERLRGFEEANRAIALQDQEAYEAQRVDLMVAARERGIDIQGELSAKELEQAIKSHDKQEAELQRHQAQVRQLYGQLIATTAQSLGQMAGEIASGQGDAEKSLGGLFASLGQMIGSFLIQMGSAAIASGIAANLLGTPAAIPAGIALVAAGAAFVALSAGLRGSLRDSGNAGGVGRAGGPRTGPTTFDRARGGNAGGATDGFVSRPSNQPVVNEYKFNFGAGAVVGTTEAGVARTLKKLLDKHTRLEGAPAGA